MCRVGEDGAGVSQARGTDLTCRSSCARVLPAGKVWKFPLPRPRELRCTVLAPSRRRNRRFAFCGMGPCPAWGCPRVHPSGTKQRGRSRRVLGVLAVRLHPWRAAILGGGSPIALGVGRRGAGRCRALCQPRLSNPLLNHLRV